MKGMKKLLSILMVLTLVLSLGATALAANEVTVTTPGPVTNEDTEFEHTYKAYQIFSGTQAESEGALGQVDWGKDIMDGDTLLSALKTTDVFGESNPFAACDSAAKVAEELGKFEDNSKEAKAFAAFVEDYINKSGGTQLTDGKNSVDPGYYLIVDISEINGEQTAQNSSMLQVTNTIEIKAKYDVPTVDKSVKDINDSSDENGIDDNDWDKSADWDIGDSVPFQLKATVQNQGYELYTTYKTILHDTQSKGLDFQPETLTLTLGGKTYSYSEGTFKTAEGDVADGVSLNYPIEAGDGCTFEIVIEDTIKLGVPAGGEIIAEYESVLNEEAEIGPAIGNPNEVYLEFSNDYNNDGTGKTPEVTVIVFTFKADVNKQDKENKPLAGAGFTLLKQYQEDNLPEGIDASSATEYTYDNLKAAADGKELPKLFTDGENYWLALEATEVTGGTTFSFEGIDDGVYKLVETKVPDGFNKADDIDFTVTVSHNEEDGSVKAFTSLDVDGTGVTVLEDAGVRTGVKADVVNYEGTTLPETGGIGTTIFYIAGAILVAGAVIILVTKKRVSGAEK